MCLSRGAAECVSAIPLLSAKLLRLTSGRSHCPPRRPLNSHSRGGNIADGRKLWNAIARQAWFVTGTLGFDTRKNVRDNMCRWEEMRRPHAADSGIPRIALVACTCLRAIENQLSG